MNDIGVDNKLLKVGIYLRLSNEDKDKQNKDDDSESIKNQRNMLIDYIEKHEEFVLFDEYCDKDLSGAGTYRPEFERLITDCENKKIDVVLCKSQSRFSRDMEIIEKYINNKFKEWNIRFIGLSDNADTDNIGNKKSRQINGLVNEWYLEDVSNNIRSAFLSKMKQGEFISPFAVFGYKISEENNNKLVVDNVAAEIVKSIYNLYLTGLGFTAIAKYLNSRNIPSPSFYKYQNGIKLNINSNRPREEIKWTTNAIKTILTNEIYLGHLIQGKRTTVSYKNHKIKKKDEKEWVKVKNTHEAIIDEETFNKVQKVMKERTKPIKITGLVHIFSGKVFCLECGHYMRKKNSNKYEYLVCSENRDGYDECVNKTSIRYDVLENIILEVINNKIQKFQDIKELENLYLKSKKYSFSNQIISLKLQKNNIEKQISSTKNYLKNVYEDKVNGIITLKQFKDLMEEYNKNEDSYNEQIRLINRKITHLKTNNESFKNVHKIFSKYQKFDKLNKIIIDEFIDKIYVGKINKKRNSRDIQIKWNFK